MHQEFTRLLRMTPDGRPFTADYKDLFSTLIVSLPLRVHRVHFRSYPFSFMTEEAILNLRYLKLTRSSRSPDVKDASKIVVTTNTTTFSMTPEIAKALCQRFILSHFIESVSEKNQMTFKDKTIWKLTPKGIAILSRFVKRNGVNTPIINELLMSPQNTMHLVILERDSETDMILQDSSMVEVIFRRFLGSRPNIVSSNISDSSDDYIDGCLGVRIIEQKYMEFLHYCFNGLSAFLWLIRCCTTMTYSEAIEIATIFINHELIIRENVESSSKSDNFKFSASKNDIYMLTKKGIMVSGWMNTNVSTISTIASKSKFFSLTTNRKKNVKNLRSQGIRKGDLESLFSQQKNLYDINSNLLNNETNYKRLHTILNDPALRFQFRVFLQQNYCEENLSFYVESTEFFQSARQATNLISMQDSLTKAYDVYNAFIADGSPCELNLDYALKQDLADCMAAVVLGDKEIKKTLDLVISLFDRAQKQVFRLMARDSVPKFLQFATRHNDDVNHFPKLNRSSSAHLIMQTS